MARRFGVEEFLTGHRDNGSADLERILATVMFTDIVDSTRQAAELGDQQWRNRLDQHDIAIRQHPKVWSAVKEVAKPAAPLLVDDAVICKRLAATVWTQA
jgi:hypothetical protein